MSLARRAWWSLVATVAGTVALAALAGWITARGLLYNEVDEVFTRRAERYALSADAVIRQQVPEVPSSQLNTFVARFAAPDGRLLRVSGGAWPDDLPTRLPVERRIVPWRGADGASYRLLQMRTSALSPGDGMPASAVMVAAVDVSQTEQSVRRLAVLLASICSVAVLAAVLIAGRMRDRLLEPVRTINRAIDALPSDALDARLGALPLPHEVRLIAERVDHLLQRLSQSRARERRTVADIAHELRTPLAALRSELDFARLGDDASPLIERLSREAQVLQDRLERLLLLGRLEAGAQPVAWSEVAFDHLVEDAWRAEFPPIDAQRWRLDVEGARDTALAGDPTLLAIVTRNLVSNAVAHGDGGVLAVRAAIDGDAATCEFVNDASRQPPGDRDAAFRPFWSEGDAPRDGLRHAGLGLAVVRRIARVHGATVSARVDDRRRFVVTLRWPLAGLAAPTARAAAATAR